MYKTFFNTPWQSPDFGHQVRQLAVPFQREFKLPPVHQLGIIVPDVEAAATELEQQRLGPFFVAAGAPTRWDEAGGSRPMAGKLAMAYLDGIEIELLEPGIHTHWYRDSLDAGGPFVIQHLGYLVPDVDLAARRLQDAGFPLRIRGCLGTLGMRCQFAYIDTQDACGYITELIDLRWWGVTVPPAKIYRPLARLQKLLGVRRFDM